MLAVRRALLLVAFYLLISAATAHAECAWVLWSETSVLTSNPIRTWWSIDETTETKARCDTTLDKFRQSLLAGDGSTRQTWRAPYIYTHDSDGKPIMSVRLLCVPSDTGPRGPKEK